MLFTAGVVFGANSILDPFYATIRQNDLGVLRKLVKESGPNVADGRGNTPLMLAAGFGTKDALQILIESAAQVNAANSTGTTALMWGAHDLAKVRLLVEKGADINAKTKQGRTALMVAAMTPDSLPLVRFLLDHGADPNIITPPFSAVGEAISVKSTATAKLLLEETPPELLKSPLGGLLLMSAAQAGDLEITKLLLLRGVDANSVSPPVVVPPVKNGDIQVGLLTSLMLGVSYADPALVEALLDSGANPNARDVRGMTPLIFAIGTDRPNPRTIQLLLSRGADPKIRDKYGDDAIAWARKFQNKPVMAAMGLRAETPAIVKLPGTPVRSNPGAAAEKALALLQQTNPTALREGGCPSCHSQNIVGMAVNVANAAGLKADLVNHRESATAALHFMKQFEAVIPQGMQSPGGPDMEQYAVAQMKSAGIEWNQTIDTIILNEMRLQRADGAWHISGFGRPPVEDSEIHRTAMGIRILQEYPIPALSAETRNRVRQAAKWLNAQQPISTDDCNMQILGLVWAGGGDVSQRAAKLIAMQRADGGWGQTPWLPSDAYATGQTLQTLHMSGIPASHTAYRRGVDFLLRSQLPDGSWYVKSRSPKFQPFFQSGFPHNDNQWISSFATAWAVMGLAHAALPVPLRAD